RAGETWLNAPTFSPDGKILAWVSPDGTVYLTDAATGKELGRCKGQGRSWFAFTPDGKSLVTRAIGGGAVTAWDVPSGKVRRRFSPTTGHLPNSAISLCEPGMAVSPDGKTLAASGDGNAILLLDLATGKEALVLGGHETPIGALDFTTDGKAVISAAADDTVRMWDPATGKEVRRVRVSG